MLTKCPGCSTTFRVTTAQLKPRAGKVRCGQCGFVFNALDTLSDDPPGAAEEIIFPEQEAVENVVEPAQTASSDTAVTAPDEIPETGPFLHEESAPPMRRGPWIVGILVTFLVLTVQMLYHYRVELAVLRPDWRPWLEATCKSFRCTVPRPQHIDLLGIESSDLRPDPEIKSRLTLLATLRSRAPFAQEWPALELTLTDVADRKLAVKDFRAGDYLPNGANLAAGFPANGEIAVSLPLDVSDLPAAGYRLYMFYP